MSCHFIRSQWLAGSGEPFSSKSPATGQTVWTGRCAATEEITSAVAAARAASPSWAATPLADRIVVLRSLEHHYRENKDRIAATISDETAKPRWEALTEVDSMIGKIAVSIEAYNERCREQSRQLGGAVGFTRFRPHGVLAVLGPFNMPGHLPNGHLVPALLAGNTVVLKPSEQTPLVGQVLAEAFDAAGFPPGVFNMVQGSREIGAMLAASDLNGILFTGSTAGGLTLRRTFADDPGRILALEMGGNNPLIFHGARDLTSAAAIIIQSAYITAGQRCSCARRLICVRGPETDALIDRLLGMIGKLRVGLPADEPEPFMGPVISARAAESLLAAQDKLVRGGGRTLVAMQRSPRCPALLTPGLIDVTDHPNRPDAEFFGPLLQLIRVENFDAAVAEANRTAYGLSAGLISDNEEIHERFLREIRAGVLAWNRPLTGASSQLPFGGLGRSGNHRPGGYLAADYASYSQASLESAKLELPPKLPPGIAL